MTILLLLTLIGLAVGLDRQECNGRVNGVYPISPCSNSFHHCYNGHLTVKYCSRGLVFNPESGYCDYDANVDGCEAREELSCKKRADGVYTIGCSSSFIYCSNGVMHQSRCQSGLFYDIERNTCDHKFRIRACGGHPEAQRDPVTHPPLSIPTYPPVSFNIRRRNVFSAYISGTVPSSMSTTLSCDGKPDGPQAINGCSQQYVTCRDGVSQMAECPDEEVFSGDAKKCAQVSEVPDCTRLPETSNSPIDCSFREDGYHGVECESTFVFCSGGKTLTMECPSNLVFNEKKGYCDYAKSCGSSKVSDAETKSGAATAVLTADSSKFVSSTFCAHRNDGSYSDGCTADYVTCDRGVATAMRCPENLVFDGKKGFCDYPENCTLRTFRSQESEPILATKTESALSCTGRPNGYHAEGCSSDFVLCTDGVATAMKCPDKLIFNKEKGYCDYPEECEKQASRKVVVGATIHHPQAARKPTASMDCTGRNNGYHSDGCSPEFVFCNDGVTTAMECPLNLVFNMQRQQCDYPENCALETKNMTTRAPVLASPGEDVFDCTGKTNGHYSNGCTSTYFYCNEGHTVTMKCPSSLVYSQKKGDCDYLENCSVENAVPPKAAPLRKNLGKVHSPVQATTVDCNGKEDGYYSSGCTTAYVFCSGGVATVMQCPPTLVFNSKKGQCDYAESCSTAPPAPAPAAQIVVPAQAAAAQLPVVTAPAETTIDCKGRKDGYYSNGCSPTYVFCSEGVATSMNCPATLVFNEKKGQCDYAETCLTGVTLSQSAMKPETVQSTVTVTQTQTHAAAPPVGESFTDCKTKKDGYYSKGCTSEFVFCNEGTATKLVCPSSLVFNDNKGYCDYPENCTPGTVATPTASVALSTSAAAARAPATAQIIDCVGKKDGYYSNGCSPTFVFCNAGVAVSMKCPPELVFNEKKGYCDYVENCSSDVAVSQPVSAPVPIPGPATAPAPDPVPAPEPAMQAPTPIVPPPLKAVVDCKEKKDGYYSNGCVNEYVFCNGGVATAMRCPSSLVFNEKNGNCDYVENCSAKFKPDLVHSVVESQAKQQPTVAPQKIVECKGKPDGYYSLGCTSEFVFCNEGLPTTMTCPASLVFNEKRGYCDYPEKCTPAQALTASASKPSPAPVQAPSMSSSIDCAWKKDGYYSSGCSPTFVLCSGGVATSMKCPPSLVFNEKKGHCDYVENCAAEHPATSLVPRPVVKKPHPEEALRPPAPAPAPESILAPTPLAPAKVVKCAEKKDGYYSTGCTPEFTLCSGGVATIMQCPPTLVFNEEKGHCDYVENCSGKAKPDSTHAVKPMPALIATLDVPTSPGVECTGKPNGYYSNGCVAEFAYCSEGTAIYMKCPPPLVFSEKKGQCDYVESCSLDVPSTVVIKPVVPTPIPAATPVPIPAPAQTAPPSKVSCAGKVNGYYANGCSSEFVYCNDGFPTAMSCPPTLVFNEKVGHCDYPKNCIEAVAPQPMPTVPSMSAPTEAQTQPSSSPINCAGKSDGYYSNGCTNDFTFCTEGVATPMKCPLLLVFNKKKGQCDYPENCTPEMPHVPQVQPPKLVLEQAVQAQPASTRSINCKEKKDGFYSSGCSPEFVYCSEGVATQMKCPVSLVFNEKSGQCDYPENCLEKVSPPMAPVPLPQTSPPAPALSPPYGVMDCTGKPNGYHSNGCSSDFVFCSEGVTTVMKCPPTLVFNEKKGYCDYTENCSPSVPVPSPLPSSSPEISQTTPSAASTSASISTNCTGRTGYYSLGCSSEFVYCNEGIATLMKCPSSLVYDEKTGYCDYPRDCKEDAPSVTPAPEAAQTPPVIPSATTTSLDCTGRTNGYHSNGCSAVFVYCTDGIATVMKCPDTLLFNEKKGYCDYPENCISTALPATPPVAEPIPAQTEHPLKQSPPTTSGPMDCTGRPNGYYSNGCSPDFFLCNEGVATVMAKCPQTLVFNEKNGYCDYAETCSSDVPVKPSSEQPTLPAQTVQPPAQAPTTVSADCTGRPNGYHSVGCTSDFVYCADGVSILMKCPEKLVFNKEKGYCDYPENCSGGVPSPEPSPTLGQLNPLQGQSQTVSSNTDCTGKKNGYYANGCSPDFVYCSEGVATQMKCPNSLVYNEKAGHCDYAEACSSSVQPTGSHHDAKPTTSQPPSLSQPSLHLDCTGRPNGHYSNGCTVEFVYCSEGTATKMKCPPSLVFNAKKGYCDYPEACSSESPTAQSQPEPAQPPAVQPSAVHSPTQAKPLDCAGRANGHYSNGCSSDFVLCNDGMATMMKCPNSLVFNEKMGYCDYPESCSSEGGSSPIPLPPVSQPQMNSPPDSVISCSDRKDGYYSNGCSEEFVYCLGGVAAPMRCPGGLVYNEIAGYCDYPEYCSRDRTEPLPGTPESSQPPSLHPPPSTAGVCAGRPNGYFSNGCSADFVNCNEGVATVMHCPSSLVFNDAMGYCDYPAVCSSPGELGYSAQESPKPSKPQISFVCPKPSGVFSVGCTVEFVVCSNALPQLMTCPEGLVFNAALGFCDLKDKCSEGEMGKPPAKTVSSPSSDRQPPEISNECANLPDGKFGSHCGSEFMVCSNGVSYSMNCPAGLVFDSKTNRCVYPDDCGGKSKSQSQTESITPSYIPQTTRNDCVGKPDGIHSLGCIGEFLQCVDGKTYSLYCPAGLVYVEKAGACDVPSACKQESKPGNVTGPVSYEPVMESKGGVNDTISKCQAEGYFSHFCAVEFFNCVHGRVFVGKCPAGLVFNYRKSSCDYVESCAGVQQKEPTASVILPVPDTQVNQDSVCKDKPDGIVTDVDCQPQFTTCLSGIAYVTKCPAGLVYSLKAKVCDYPEACGKTYDEPTTQASVVQSPEKPNIDYQETSVGKDLCDNKPTGPLIKTNCRSSFSFCVHGALYTTKCQPGLLFSFVSHKCEWASMCDIISDTTPHPVVTSTPHKTPVTPPSSDVPIVSSVTGFDCSSLPDGLYSLGKCVGRFAQCSSGHTYIQFCPDSLVYNPVKGVCDHECGRQQTPPAQEECSTSQALGICSSKFRRCQDGKLVPAQCPGQSVFDEKMSLCVYDLPQCRQQSSVPSSTLPHAPPPPPQFIAPPPAYSLPQSFASPLHPPPPYLTPQPQAHPFPVHFAPVVPVPLLDPLHGRDKVHKGMIPFEPRSMLEGDRRYFVKDVFDASATPYLHPFIDRIFVPKNYRQHRRHRDRDCSSQDCSSWEDRDCDEYGCKDERDDDDCDKDGCKDRFKGPKVPIDKLFEKDPFDSELSIPIKVSDGTNATTAATDTNTVAATTGVLGSIGQQTSDLLQKTLKLSDDDSLLVNHGEPNETTDMLANGEVEVDKGSGDGSMRRKRSSNMHSRKARLDGDFSMCSADKVPGVVSLGFCRQDFVFCKAVGVGVVAGCPLGDLFDTSSNKCTPSHLCGEDRPFDEPLLQGSESYAPPQAPAMTERPYAASVYKPVYKPPPTYGSPAYAPPSHHPFYEPTRFIQTPVPQGNFPAPHRPPMPMSFFTRPQFIPPPPMPLRAPPPLPPRPIPLVRVLPPIRLPPPTMLPPALPPMMAPRPLPTPPPSPRSIHTSVRVLPPVRLPPTVMLTPPQPPPPPPPPPPPHSSPLRPTPVAVRVLPPIRVPPTVMVPPPPPPPHPSPPRPTPVAVRVLPPIRVPPTVMVPPPPPPPQQQQPSSSPPRPVPVAVRVLSPISLRPPVMMPPPTPSPPSRQIPLAVRVLPPIHLPTPVPVVPLPSPPKADPAVVVGILPPVHVPAPMPSPVSVSMPPSRPVPVVIPPRTPSLPPRPQEDSQMVKCDSDVDYALDCSGKFVKCSNGIGYVMNCPEGFIFDQVLQVCNYPEQVIGCSTNQSPSTLPQPKPYPYIPQGEPIKPHRLHKPEVPDFCASLRDGLHSQGCTASFVICFGSHIQASMNCPAGTFFDETRGVCDLKEKVEACGGSLDEPVPTAPISEVTRTTAPATAHEYGCAAALQPLGRCSPKFVVCSDGVLSEFNCRKPLVFNPLTIACDFREFVPECEQFQGANEPETTTTQQTTTTTEVTTTTAPPSCVYNENRPAFALDYCTRVYGVCSSHGILKRDACAVGFLFDSQLHTCVPAEQCGQKRLEELLNKVTFVSPVAAAQVDTSLSKHESRKDDRCRNSPEGAVKPLGRCRSSYLKCVGGEATVQPCSTSAEVFSAAIGACVMRINAPECHSSARVISISASSSLGASDPSMFCKGRSDGLYRNPTSCAGILQCFGGDVFEYPPCSSGLVFNEVTSKCDYRDAVPECKLQGNDDQRTISGCRGASHGDLLPHESDCQKFYRCTWNHLEQMQCPSGTVFNEDLSVCDYPANVPKCGSQ